MGLEVLAYVTHWEARISGQHNSSLKLETLLLFRLQANQHQLFCVSFSLEIRYSSFRIYFKLLQLLKMYEHCEIN